MAEHASVIAMLAWKLGQESITRMRQADYDIAVGRGWFDFVCEYLSFLALAADRIAHDDLTPEQRAEFTVALVKRLAEMVEEAREALLPDLPPGQAGRNFLALYNRRSDEYADFGFDATGPDFGFRRCFAACIKDTLPEKDRLWAVDQVMEIESPEAIRTLQKTLAGLFHPESGNSRRSRDGVTGE
ncbi:MAG: hypothetical protein IPN05_03440 [Sulfuritalea sp.]|nr:hypothetical protein [Sulfuritalea sp.]